MSDEIIKKLAALDSVTREKLQAQILTQIDKELVAGALNPGVANAATFDKQHDRGPLFGKDFDKQGNSIEDIRQLASLDEKQFARFAERVNILRGGGGQ